MYECETPFHIKIWLTVVFTCATLFALMLVLAPVLFS